MVNRIGTIYPEDQMSSVRDSVWCLEFDKKHPKVAEGHTD